MIGIDAAKARKALAALPDDTSYGDNVALEHVHLPPSHLRASNPNNQLVTGMRGAGKTFWWSVLQDSEARQLVGSTDSFFASGRNVEVRTGFGVKSALDEYPDKDTFDHLMRSGFDPRILWRTVQACQLASGDHPIRQDKKWAARVDYVSCNPESIGRLFQDRDAELDRNDGYFLVLYDALDRCADDWQSMYKLIRGLMQTALDMRSYRRIRVKMFLRTDQLDEERIADFPDASKILSSSVELSWPPHELYGLLWHLLGNGTNGNLFRTFLGDDNWHNVRIGKKAIYRAQRKLISKGDPQREKFHKISGPWMGRNRRRGFPYTWIPNHLGDTEGRVSPRSFLKALRAAAEDMLAGQSEYEYALHFDSIKRGVQEASKTRVAEIKEDYPWVDRVLKPLEGIMLPCEFGEIEGRWNEEHILEHLADDMGRDEVKLPPVRINEKAAGVREDLQSLGIFHRLRDGRVNIPDVFRVGYGLGRKGGVRPAR